MNDNNDDINNDFVLCSIQMTMITNKITDLAKENERLEHKLENAQKELIKANAQLYELTEENRKLKEELGK